MANHTQDVTFLTAADTQTRFLKRLITQMKNQYPLKAQVASQKAQPGTVINIDKMNAVLQALEDSMRSNRSRFHN